MRRWLKSAAAISIFVMAVTASVAIAEQGTGGRTERGRGEALFLAGARGDRHLSDLAEKLGVSTDKLRDAFTAVRDELGPPRRLRRGQPPTREQLERRCVELTNALASELGKSGDEVRAAIKSVIKDKIKAAVEDGRLTKDEADRMTARIDDAECLPPGPVVHGCGGPHGGPGGHFAPPGPPGGGDDRGGTQRRGSFEDELPAPPPIGV